MSQARLVVSLPEGAWLGDLSTTFPDATVRLPTALASDARAVGLCWVGATDSGAVLEWFGGRDDVEVVATLDRTATDVTVQFEAAESLLVSVVLAAGVPVEFPIEITDGKSVLDVAGDPARITDLGLRLEDRDASFTVEYVREYDRLDDQLTGKQYALVTTAVGLGYYDTPRECSLTDVADAVGLAKSTVSETLHRAEGTIVKAFVDHADDTHTNSPFLDL